jgi:ABC-type multidrug transport system ATPase subunit
MSASGAGELGYAIRTQDLRKTYKSSRGDVPAVRGIDLSVEKGQFFGLLGPNGAAKSTTIGMLTTLIVPTGGRAWVSGLDVVADPVGVKRRIGVVTQNNTLDMQLTVAENLEFRSRFFGLGLREASRRAAQLLEVFGLADRRKAMSTDLSGGQARRLLIARALVHRPDVLFLDEPTAGLDQIAVLVNPMVYMSEGLRAVLTPVLPHMPMWAVLLALVGGTVVFGYLGIRTFTNRVLN